MTANCILVGEVWIARDEEEQDGELDECLMAGGDQQVRVRKLERIMVLRFETPEDLRVAIRTGRVEFTLFGSEAVDP